MSRLTRTIYPTIPAVLCALALFKAPGCAPDRPAGSAQDSVKPDLSAPVSDRKAGSKPSQPTVAPPAIERPTLVHVVRRTTFVWPDEKGARRMSASASQLTWDDAKQIGSALDFSAELYENGKLTATMRAPKALVEKESQTVTATGGVVMKSVERQTTLKAAWVKWFAKQKRAIGDGGVTITSPMWTTEGAAFEADTALKTFTVKDSLKGLEP